MQAEALAAKESEEDDDDDDYSYNEIDPMLKKKLLQVISCFQFHSYFSQRDRPYVQKEVASGNFFFNFHFIFHNENVPPMPKKKLLHVNRFINTVF